MQTASGQQVHLTQAANQWPTPNVPNGGRTLTPEAIEAKGATANGKRQVWLENVAQNWPTARAEDAESCGQHPDATDSLNATAKNWPTPNANPEAPNMGLNRGAGRIGARNTETSLGLDAKNWATPEAHNGRRPTDGKSTQGGNLQRDSENWPTPDANATTQTNQSASAGAALRPNLAKLAQNWATPSPNDYKGSAKPGQRRGQLSEQAETLFAVNSRSSRPEKTTTSLGRLLRVWTRPSCPVLNVRFEEMLMGWRLDWTSVVIDYESGAMGYARWRQRLLSLLYGIVSR
jgi:hypothetical protein